MSDVTESYLFFDRLTGDFIFEKKSKSIDYTFDCGDFYSIKRNGELPKVGAVAEGRLRLLEKKVKVVLMVRTILDIIDKGVENDFSAETLSEIPIDDLNISKFQSLMDEERALLKERVAVGRRRFEDRILTAPTIEDVETEFLLMRRHVQIGIYSPIERERRKAYGLY